MNIIRKINLETIRTPDVSFCWGLFLLVCLAPVVYGAPSFDLNDEVSHGRCPGYVTEVQAHDSNGAGALPLNEETGHRHGGAAKQTHRPHDARHVHAAAFTETNMGTGISPAAGAISPVETV